MTMHSSRLFYKDNLLEKDFRDVLLDNSYYVSIIKCSTVFSLSTSYISTIFNDQEASWYSIPIVIDMKL